MDDRLKREHDFWGHQIPPLDHCLAEVRAGPDPNTAMMLDAVEPLAGRRVLDFACGAGPTTAWLVQRGADVVGIDLSPGALARSDEILQILRLEATLVARTLEDCEDLGTFDAIVGRYALHHTDVQALAPLLAGFLRPGGKAAFVETFASNPVLRLSRRHIVGRLGVPRLGTLDEQPLRPADVRALKDSFGSGTVTVGQMAFLRIFDRQVLHYRFRRVGRALARIDDVLHRLPGSGFLSYYQVVVLEKNR